MNIGRVDRQGCGLSLILFNLYRFGYFKIGGKVIRTVKCADYLVLLAKEETVLQGVIDSLIEIDRCYGMEMNVEKTKVMRILGQP